MGSDAPRYYVLGPEPLPAPVGRVSAEDIRNPFRWWAYVVLSRDQDEVYYRRRARAEALQLERIAQEIIRDFENGEEVGI